MGIQDQQLFVKSDLNEESFRKLLPLFFEEVGEDLKAIEQAQKRNNNHQIRQIAHKVKGTSLSYSALKVSAEAEKLQACIDAEENEDLENRIQALKTSINESYAYALRHYSIKPI